MPIQTKVGRCFCLQIWVSNFKIMKRSFHLFGFMRSRVLLKENPNIRIEKHSQLWQSLFRKHDKTIYEMWVHFLVLLEHRKAHFLQCLAHISDGFLGCKTCVLLFKPSATCFPREQTAPIAFRRSCTGAWLWHATVPRWAAPLCLMKPLKKWQCNSSALHSGWRINPCSHMNLRGTCSGRGRIPQRSGPAGGHLQVTARAWTHSPRCLLCIKGRNLKHNRVRDISQAVLTSDVTRLAATCSPGRKPARGALRGARCRAAWAPRRSPDTANNFLCLRNPTAIARTARV